MLKRGLVQKLCAASAGVVVAVLMLESAKASFAPVFLTGCPYYANIPFTYYVGGGTGLWELPNDPTNANNYINNINNWRYFIANKYARDVTFTFSAFSTEASWDFLYFDRSGNWPPSAQGTLTGDYSALVPMNRGVTASSSSLQAIPVYFNFYTDPSVTKPGFAITQANVCFSTADNTMSGFAAGDRIVGLTMGNNDVVYFNHYVDWNVVDTTAALWGWSVAGSADLDLYMRCGAVPTDTQYDYVGFSGDAQEFIHIPNGACPANQIMYFAVHQYNVPNNQPAAFSAMIHEHDPGRHGSGITAGMLFNAWSSQINDWRCKIRNGMRLFFGATEGAFYWDQTQVLNNTGNQPYQIHSESGQAHSGLCTDHVDLYDGAGDGELVVMHESGHFFGCLQDEYNDVGSVDPSHCGHSIMGNFWNSPQNFNLCYCYNWNGSYCPGGSGDHDKDGDASPDHIRSPAWNVLPAVPPYRPTKTPDNYSYENFDFNNMYAHLVPYVAGTACPQ